MQSLCQAIIWTACFLEFSEDDLIDPDSAMKALEDIAATLQAATREEKEDFASACNEEANRLAKEAGLEYSKTAEFVRGLPDSFGL